MKLLKHVWLFVLALLVTAIFVGCNFIDYTYPLDQSMDNVKSVEVCSYDYESNSTSQIVELDKETAKALLTDITALACHKYFGDHTLDYGPVVLYITYTNGEAEVIGMCNSASVDLTGEWWISIYYFDDIQWCNTVLKYVDPEMVPQLVEYMERYDLVHG